MKQIRILPLLLPLLLICGMLSAQKKEVTGIVTDKETKAPLAGVSVIAENKKGGTATKRDGTFSLTLEPGTTTLIFSSIGYATQMVLIEGKTKFAVALAPEAAAGSEVVVIGYGSQKRDVVTGAVAKYKNENLVETPSSRLDQALQGKIAGVQIQNISPEAGADPKVSVRGATSISASAAPLVVIDGHPVPDGLAFVNIADVESVEVLKDAASAAIYGSRGSGGVIIVTTKSGKEGKIKYGLKASTGVKQAYKLYPMMTTTEYTNLLFEEAALKAKDPSVPPLTASQIATTPERGAYIIEQQLRGGEATDWQKEAIRDVSTTNIQLSASGGTKALKYYISGGYQNDPGMMYHSEYERFNVKSKIDAQLGKKVKFSLNISPSYIKRERPSTGYIDFVRFGSYLPVRLNEELAAFVRQDAQYSDVRAGDFAQARYFNGRVYSGTMPDGSIWTNSTAVTPFNTSNNTPKSVLDTRKITTEEYRVLGLADISVNILPGLDFKTIGSIYVNYGTGLDFANRSSNRAGDVNRGAYSSKRFVDLLNENTLNYSRRINNHSFSVLAGFTVQKRDSTASQVVGLDYPSDNITTLNTALIIDQSKDNTWSVHNQTGLLSYLGRVIYSYADKYLLTASFRRDGSSIFGPGNKWGNFPSVTVGWVASREGFLQNVKWLSNLKLRGSYGVTGNNAIVPYAFVDQLYPANYAFGSNTGTLAQGQVPNRDILANPAITWESTFQFNGGLDLGLFKNRVSLSLDIYQTKTDQLLLKQSTLGFTGVPQTWNNIGRVQNNGIELELSTVNIRTKNFKWTTSANISHVKNKVLELGDEALILNQGERTELYMNTVGSPLIQFYGYKTDGVWLSQDEVDAARAKGLTSNLSNVFVPGGLKLVDTNGDNVLDANDRVVTGNPYPDFIYGINNSFNYKGFDLSIFVQGVQGGSLVNGDANYNETKRYNRNYNSNRWLSPMFPGDGKTPYSTFGFNWMLTDYVVEDASYYALREILLGYTLPEKWTSKLKLSSVRLYASAQNLYFHFASGYRGINPEARSTSGNYYTPLVDGYQRGSFPTPRTYQIGLDLNF